MKKSQTELTYMRTAAQTATPAGLVIILYDLLVHDLEQALAAFAGRDIERRTAEIKHAFLVLQQLEGSLNMEKGGEAAKTLSRFYSALRRNIFQAQLKADPDILRKQIDLVLDVRQAWQGVDKPNLESSTKPAASGPAAAAAAGAGAGEATSSNWTA
jgi:flagellar secretion chaperone FliS